ncbi:hypothetical protein DICVIV_04820 [Dictyocaulus viviparus]|uniref:Uncharacterized protein n=1 Tax=Dictyocaulus viviparus TaxID=29172 RepID=A0A0D8Y387_DICVI|nr:hypothetical protein DICVIV_04820 [Dictyocaulus viviparus]
MFRKPSDDNNFGSRIVKAKPLQRKYAEKLLMSGKDFVSSGCENDSKTSENFSSPSTSTASLSEDEMNKIHARILKAEMKGDKETVEKLKRKLEGKVVTKEPVVLLKRDKAGNIVPARGTEMLSKDFAQSSSRIHREYGKEQNLKEMMREEKSSTAADQLMLFHRSIIICVQADSTEGNFVPTVYLCLSFMIGDCAIGCVMLHVLCIHGDIRVVTYLEYPSESLLQKSAKVKRHNDESIDDIAEIQKEKYRHTEKDKQRIHDRKKKGECYVGEFFCAVVKYVFLI